MSEILLHRLRTGAEAIRFEGFTHSLVPRDMEAAADRIESLEAEAEDLKAKLAGDTASGWSLHDIQEMCAGWVRSYEREGSVTVNETEVLGLMRAVAATVSDVLAAIEGIQNE